METRVDKLYRMLEDENNSKEVLKISQDTYKEIAAHIKTIRAEGTDREKTLASELAAAERRNLSNIARRLIEVRISKFRSESDSDLTLLTMEERYITEPLVSSRKRLERIAEGIFNGQVGELQHMADSVAQKYVYARFIEPYTAISGTDLATYGPFEVEDVAILPIENAKVLLKNGIIASRWIEAEVQRE